MQDWQLRVLEEYKEINDKIRKLSNFLDSDTNLSISNLTTEQVHLMTEQLYSMQLYSNALIKRIHSFKEVNAK